MKIDCYLHKSAHNNAFMFLKERESNYCHNWRVVLHRWMVGGPGGGGDNRNLPGEIIWVFIVLIEELGKADQRVAPGLH